MFHVKDAELNPSGKQGVYGGFQSWVNRAGRFRSLGDGQVDFKSIFSKLTSYVITMVGQFLNGNAVLSIPKMEQEREQNLLKII